LKKRSKKGITHEERDHEGEASLVDNETGSYEAIELEADDKSEVSLP